MWTCIKTRREILILLKFMIDKKFFNEFISYDEKKDFNNLE